MADAEPQRHGEGDAGDAGAACSRGGDAAGGLPHARVKKMMKEVDEVKNVAPEAVFAVAHATELFLQALAGRSVQQLQAEGGARKQLDYRDVAGVVQSWEAVDFLQDIVPPKVSAAQVLEGIAAQRAAAAAAAAGQQAQHANGAA